MSPKLPQAFAIRQAVVEREGVKTFILDGDLMARPGQFVMVWLPGAGEKPFSLMDDRPLSLTVAKVGPFSGALHSLCVGERVWIRGPLGQGFTLRGERILLIGGGYGVAPLFFLAKLALAESRWPSVLIAARTRDELLFKARFAALGCEVMVCTDDGSAGRCGLAPAVAADLLAQAPFEALYACGPEAMLDEVTELARRKAIPCQVSREAYMRCAIGVCGSCHYGDRLVCRDGPVFTVFPETL